jgi:hypothetical protein
LVTALFKLDEMWNLSKDEITIEESKSKKDSPKKAKTEEDAKILKSKSGLDRLIKFAKEMENSLKSRGTTRVVIKNKMSLKEARLISEVFYKAYDGRIPALQINQETLAHLKKSKHLSGIDMVQSYPALFKHNQAATYKAVPQPGQGPLIKLSRDQLQMTICKHTPGSSIKLDSTSKRLQQSNKFVIDNNSRKLVRTGNSSALVIQDLKRMIRELLFEDYNYDISPNNEMFSEIKTLLTENLSKVIKIASEGKNLENQEEVNLLYGTLETIASLIQIVQPG